MDFLKPFPLDRLQIDVTERAEQCQNKILKSKYKIQNSG